LLFQHTSAKIIGKNRNNREAIAKNPEGQTNLTSFMDTSKYLTPHSDAADFSVVAIAIFSAGCGVPQLRVWSARACADAVSQLGHALRPWPLGIARSHSGE
jgi:hypothetical protein